MMQDCMGIQGRPPAPDSLASWGIDFWKYDNVSPLPLIHTRILLTSQLLIFSVQHPINWYLPNPLHDNEQCAPRLRSGDLLRNV
jgi:hypothetical protein